jgi:hypothetical protein
MLLGPGAVVFEEATFDTIFIILDFIGAAEPSVLELDGKVLWTGSPITELEATVESEGVPLLKLVFFVYILQLKKKT